jgi:hypothetical protein
LGGGAGELHCSSQRGRAHRSNPLSGHRPAAAAAPGIEVKPSDSRAAKYREEYGDRCWEADVLPAAVIAQALDHDIRSWIDAEAWQRRDTEIERARALL